MNEFTEACEVLRKCSSVDFHSSQIEDIAKSLDLNKDGKIDFNEFLEAFRIVDTREMRERTTMIFETVE